MELQPLCNSTVEKNWVHLLKNAVHVALLMQRMRLYLGYGLITCLSEQRMSFLTCWTSFIERGPNATFCENTIRRGHNISSNRIGTRLKIELSLVTRANWSDSWQLAHLTGNTCYFFNIRKPSLFTWSRAEPCRKSNHCSSRAGGGITEGPAGSRLARPLQIPMQEITTQINETWLAPKLELLLADSDTHTRVSAAFPICTVPTSCTHLWQISYISFILVEECFCTDACCDSRALDLRMQDASLQKNK